MTEQIKEKESGPQTTPAPSPPTSAAPSPPPATMESLVLEINKIPKEYWPNLMEIIRLFGESVAMNSPSEDPYKKVVAELKNPDPVLETARQTALSELLRSWTEEGDEQEQKETWEFLKKALDEDRLSSNRPLFPHE